MDPTRTGRRPDTIPKHAVPMVDHRHRFVGFGPEGQGQSIRGNHGVHQRLLHGGCLSPVVFSHADRGTGVQTGRVDLEGEHAIDQSERIGERFGRHSVPQGPVYGRGVREFYRDLRRVGDGGLYFSSLPPPL